MLRPTAHAHVGQTTVLVPCPLPTPGDEASVIPRFHDMASQDLRSTPVYASVVDYECDSNPAYGVVESRNQTSTEPEHGSPESGARADSSLTTAADTVTVSYDCIHSWYDLCMAYDILNFCCS